MTDHSSVKLNASEISSLWLSYMNNSLTTTMIKYFLNNVQDKDIKAQLESANSLVTKYLKTIAPMLQNEGLPLPNIFSDNDVDLKAPQLFSEIFYLYYLSSISRYGLGNSSINLYNAARSDVRRFYADCLIEITEFYYNLSGVMLSKGLMLKTPTVEATKMPDLVKSKDFFAGIFKQPRPLLLVEISNIFSNMLNCLTGRTLVLGFAQVAETNEVKKYLYRGKEMLDAHIEYLSKLLIEEDVPVASISDIAVTDSTQAAISERMMLYHTSIINVMHIRNFTDAIATTLRKDITVGLARLTAEIANYASDGMDIMMRNGWMEQPPQLVSHRELVGL